MKISAVSQNLQTLINWLNNDCKIKGRVPVVQRVDQVKVWHDDILPLRADRGDVRVEYNVDLPENCQNHIVNFEFIPHLRENYQYVIPFRAGEVAINVN